jgi:hypothetical protein
MMTALRAAPMKNCCADKKIVLVVAFSLENPCSKKSLFHRMFCNVANTPSMGAARCNDALQRGARASKILPQRVVRSAKKRLVTRSHCFFCFAGVHEM